MNPVEMAADRVRQIAAGTGGEVGEALGLIAVFMAGQERATQRQISILGNVVRAAAAVYPDEGEGLVFMPDTAGGFSLAGRIPPRDWAKLLRLDSP